MSRLRLCRGVGCWIGRLAHLELLSGMSDGRPKRERMTACAVKRLEETDGDCAANEGA